MKSRPKEPSRKPQPQKKHQSIEGTISINSKGVGYVTPLGGKRRENDIEIAHEDLGTALHADVVKVSINAHGRSRNTTGKVTEILDRAKKGFAGTFAKEHGRFFLVPDDTRMYVDLLIPDADTLDACVGQKVFAVISSWNDPKKAPIGKVTRILGTKGENNAEMMAIALERGFDEDFPLDVLSETDHIAEKADSKNELAERRDMRSILTFTIDPADAKDFDDALSFQKLPNGNVEIGIHIADVSHYVRPGTALDDEARERATSVYLVDRTIPMLPEVLSNDLCSLNQGEDKLTMSAIFEIDSHAQVKSQWFGRTIIHSDKRFTYEEAQEILNNKSGLYFEELETLNTLAKKLTKERFAQGAIFLDQDEVKFVLDDKGVPIRVIRKVRIDTNKLIEEFMLLANRRVAEFIAGTEDKRVFVYRIHDFPDKEKMKNLADYLAKLGHKVTLKNGLIPTKELNALLTELEGNAERSGIQTAIVRSMAKAIYSTQNIGHYGLGFEFYTHFTSPIRRYPDVVVHRLLAGYLKDKHIPTALWNDYEKIALHSSRREKEAADAERSSIKYKQVEYMSSHIGEVLDAIVTGVSQWGLYAEEKETKCEGMIKLADIGNDFFELNEKEMSLSGKKSKKVFRIGTPIKIKVLRADMDKKIIDYALMDYGTIH